MSRVLPQHSIRVVHPEYGPFGAALNVSLSDTEEGGAASDTEDDHTTASTPSGVGDRVLLNDDGSSAGTEDELIRASPCAKESS